MKKKLKFLLLIGIMVFLSSQFLVRAEDDDEREDEDREEDSAAAPEPKTQTQTYQTTSVTTLKDSDGDGLLDRDDPHPEIGEIYIVEDKNLNGIVDQFEK